MKKFSIDISDWIAAAACIYFAIANAYPQVITILLCMVLAELGRIRKAIATPTPPSKG